MVQINSLKALKKELADSARVGKTDIYTLHPDMIEREPGFNTRGLGEESYFELPHMVAHIRRLADAYKAGEQMPALLVKVKDGRVFLRDGECRMRGIALARSEGAEIVKVGVQEVRGDEVNETLALLTTQDGMKLTPLEKAATYQRLINYGLSVKEVAGKVRRTDTHVRQLLELMDLPLALKTAIQAGTVSSDAASKLFKEHGHKAVDMLDKAAKHAEANGKSKVKPKDLKPAGAKPKGPKITKRFVSALHTSFSGFSEFADRATVSDDGKTATIQIPVDRLNELKELEKNLAELEQAPTAEPASKAEGEA